MNFIPTVLDSEVLGFLPTRAHANDAGLDLFTPTDVMLLPGESVLVDIGVAMAIPSGWCGLIKSKSGLATKESITADIGVIDSGYTGNIKVLLHNGGKRIKRFHRGDKIAQIVITVANLCTPKLVAELAETERGNNGFGSTGV